MDKNPSGCKSPDTFYRDYGKNGVDLMYQTLMQALIHNKPVRVYVTGACDLYGYAEISEVRLSK